MKDFDPAKINEEYVIERLDVDTSKTTIQGKHQILILEIIDENGNVAYGVTSETNGVPSGETEILDSKLQAKVYALKKKKN